MFVLAQLIWILLCAVASFGGGLAFLLVGGAHLSASKEAAQAYAVTNAEEDSERAKVKKRWGKICLAIGMAVWGAGLALVPHEILDDGGSAMNVFTGEIRPRGD